MITNIHLQNFRSYKEAAFELADGVNVIVGPNASGKTNLLEAVLVLARGKSYRGDDELVQFGKPWSRLEAHTPSEERIVKLEKVNDKLHKSYVLNGQTFHRLSLNKSLPVVLFEPQHLRLLHGPPELRRDYLDELLEQTVAGYGTLRRSYRRALAQRNALLKSQPAKLSQQLFVWDVRLGELAGQMVKFRLKLVEQINESLGKLYGQLSHTKSKAAISYVSNCQTDNYESDLLAKLQKHLDVDMARGFTGYGPHRDDFQIELNRHQAQSSASRGEIRTLLLALKIVELKQLEDLRDTKPLLLLDDVFSELDGSRRQALTEFLKDYQTFITTTDADVVAHHFAGQTSLIALGS